MTVCNRRSRCVKPGRRHRFLDNVTLSADYNSKKKCRFRANTGPAPCLQAQCNQNPSLLLLVGCWATTNWRSYHQAFSATTPIWDLHTILIYVSSYFARFINYQRKLVKYIPKLMCSEVSVFKNNFLFNRSLLYCIISLSKTALPSVAF